MAQSPPKARKPRIRKSAPTVRQMAEAARAKDEAAKPAKFSRLKAKSVAPFKKMRLKDRQFVKVLAKVFRPVGKVLAWLMPSYFVNSWREVRQVQWPSRKETWRLTLAVFIFAIVFGALVAGVDRGLDEVFKKVVLK